MVDKWHEVWNKRSSAKQSQFALIDLLALDGFDSGAGKIELIDLKEYSLKIAQKLQLKKTCCINILLVF